MNVQESEKDIKISKLGNDPYKAICTALNKGRTFSKYQLDYLAEGVLDQNLQKKLIMAKLQALLGDKYLKQMFASMTLQKIEQDSIVKMQDPDLINKHKYQPRSKSKKITKKVTNPT